MRFRIAGFAAVMAMGGFLMASSASAQSNGEKIYKGKCVGCHSLDGSGSSPAGKAMKARDFCSGDAAKEPDAEWTDIITKGKNKMPSFDKKLSDSDIKDVVAYIRSLCKK